MFTLDTREIKLYKIDKIDFGMNIKRILHVQMLYYVSKLIRLVNYLIGKIRNVLNRG